MNITSVLRWTPRVLGILFILFISMFALDIFGQGYNIWETIVGLFMHLIPTWILLFALIVAWKRTLAGGLLFMAVGIFFLLRFSGGNYWQSTLYIALPPGAIGVLFLLDWGVHHRSGGK